MPCDSPRRPWTALAVAAVAMVATLPGRTQGLGLITEPLIDDLGIDRVTFAGVNLWATLIGAAFCVPCGRLVDRFGSGVVVSVVLLALGASVMGLSVCGGLVALAVALTLTRGFGQSALSVASLALVGKWFSRRLAVAMGVYSVLVGIGFIVAFPSVGQAVLRFGWRQAWFTVGLCQVALLGPAAWFLVPGRSRERGHPGGSTEPDGSEHDLSLRDAVASPAFWVFALSSSIFGLVYSGISLFNQSILEERGFDVSTYHRVLVISTLVGLIANFGGGFLATRWPIQRVMGIGMAALATALLGLPAVVTQAHVVLYGVAMGASGGIVTVVFFSVWGRVFGRRHLGRIQGCAQTMTVFASAIGPLLLARALARTGSYASIFYALAAVVVALGVGCWYVTLPRRVRHRRGLPVPPDRQTI